MPRPNQLPRAGVMLYTFEGRIGRDLEPILQGIADIGYLGVETYGLEGRSPSAVRAALDTAGLELASAHAPIANGDEPRVILDDLALLGARTVACSIEPEDVLTIDHIGIAAERLNVAARRASEYGMRLAYHNHPWESATRHGGRTAYQLMLDRLDPIIVVELDYYWVALAGDDPAAVMAESGDRVRLLHVKDGPARDYQADVMEPIGQGSLDTPATLRAGTAVEWHLVELERLHVEVFEALRQSYAYLVDEGLSEGRAPTPTRVG